MTGIDLAFVGGFVVFASPLFIWAAKFLIDLWFKKEAELVKLKRDSADSQLRNFDEKIKSLENVTKGHAKVIVDFTVKLQQGYTRYDAQTDSVKAAVEQLKETSKEIRVEFRELRNEVVALGKDVAMYKGRKP